MKERKIKNIKTYYLSDADINFQEKFEELAYKERTSVSELYRNAVQEYLQKHGDGNPVYTLDQFNDESMKAVPAVFRNSETWNNYYSKLNKTQYKEIDQQFQMILNIHNKKLNDY